jgi:hypothetical protein
MNNMIITVRMRNDVLGIYNFPSQHPTMFENEHKYHPLRSRFSRNISRSLIKIIVKSLARTLFFLFSQFHIIAASGCANRAVHH